MKPLPPILALVLSLAACQLPAQDSTTSLTEDMQSAMLANAPLPFGVGVWYFGQDSEYEVTRLKANIFPGIPLPGFGANAIQRIENRIDQANFKADWWVTPWLNVHGIFGAFSGEAHATLNPFVRPLVGGNLQVSYDGFVFGGGITLAACYKNLFASLTADYTWGTVDLNDGGVLSLDDPSGVETLIITPKIGIQSEKGAIWVGAYYQHVDHTQSGSFTHPLLGKVNFDADVRDKADWGFVVGGEYHFNKHWSLTAELGFGEDRTQVLSGITYRF